MKKKQKPKSSARTQKVKCCKTCGRKPRKKIVKPSREEIESKNIAILVMFSLLAVSGLAMQSKYWMQALPLLVICCLPKTVYYVVSVTYFVRCRIGKVLSFFKEILKWVLPIGLSLKLSIFFVFNYSDEFSFGDDKMLFLAVFSFISACLLFVSIVLDLTTRPKFSR